MELLVILVFGVTSILGVYLAISLLSFQTQVPDESYKNSVLNGFDLFKQRINKNANSLKDTKVKLHK